MTTLHAPSDNWRHHVIQWTARQALRLDKGVFVECGSHKGDSTEAMLKVVEQSAYVHLYDTWCGPDERFAFAKGALHYTKAECVLQQIQQRLQEYPNVRYHCGPVHDTLKVFDADVAWLHVDLNSEEPERYVIEKLWPRLLPGGILLHDDYGHPTFEAQRKMIDSHCAAVRIKPLVLPTGQAILIK